MNCHLKEPDFRKPCPREKLPVSLFIRAEHSSALRKALHARSRPDRVICQPGEIVMFWKAGKGAEPGSWHGPTKVLMVEGKNLVWPSFSDAPLSMFENCQPMKSSRCPTWTDRCSNCQSVAAQGCSNSESFPTRIIPLT